MQAQLGWRLDRQYLRLDGHTKPAERKDLIRRFAREVPDAGAGTGGAPTAPDVPMVRAALLGPAAPMPGQQLHSARCLVLGCFSSSASHHLLASAHPACW
jgi:hypothetical protein